MTYDQFLDIIKDLLELDDYCPYTYEKIFGDDWRSNKEEYVIFIEWSNGRTDYNNTKFIKAEEEPNFDKLDAILERIEPNISYLKYKKLVKQLIKQETLSLNRYYSDKTNIKYIKLKELYLFLV